MCKLDLTNAYWSIRMPRLWGRIFCLGTGTSRWRYTCLPFGWKCSPAICQRLVSAITRSALKHWPVEWDVYINDILMSSRDPQVTKETTLALAAALRRAGFIISDKCVLNPSTRITFLGKRLDSCRRSIGNEPAMLAATMCMWVLALGRGKLHPRDMARMLGRLQWVARPVGASSPFLAGAYRSMHAPSSTFTRALARSTATSLLFSIPQHKVRATTHTRRETIFADAAPFGRRFRVEVVGRPRMYRQEVCPVWVTSL